MKPKGYILFAYYSKLNNKYDGFETGEFCTTKKELELEHMLHCDDKWDMHGRNKIDYFYLDLKQNKYFPLYKWKNDCNKKDKFKSDSEKVMSKKYFKIKEA